MRKQTPQNNQRNKSIVTNCDKFHREKWPAKETGLLINMPLDTNILECPGYFLALKNEFFFFLRFFFFFDMDHFLKSLLKLLKYCFCFMFCFFG